MATPFDPQPLTPAQQQQIADRAAASLVLAEIDQDIADVNAHLNALYGAWSSASGPAIDPLAFDAIARRNSLAADYYKTHNLLNALLVYRGTVLGWKLNAGQPNHSHVVPVFTPPIE